MLWQNDFICNAISESEITSTETHQSCDHSIVRSLASTWLFVSELDTRLSVMRRSGNECEAEYDGQFLRQIGTQAQLYNTQTRWITVQHRYLPPTRTMWKLQVFELLWWVINFSLKSLLLATITLLFSLTLAARGPVRCKVLFVLC